MSLTEWEPSYSPIWEFLIWFGKKTENDVHYLVQKVQSKVIGSESSLLSDADLTCLIKVVNSVAANCAISTLRTQETIFKIFLQFYMIIVGEG